MADLDLSNRFLIWLIVCRNREMEALLGLFLSVSILAVKALHIPEGKHMALGVINWTFPSMTVVYDY